MDSSDVLASLKRWTETATRGKGAAKVISSIEAPDANTIRITLKQPYSPLTALLAMNNAAAVIMPKGKIAPVLTEIVGTGPTNSRRACRTSTSSWCASTATSSAKASPTATAAPASSTWTKSASCR